MLTAFLLVVCEPPAIARVAAGLAELPGVAEAYTTTGGADVIAIVRIEDLDALATLVTEGVAAIPGIVRTDTHLAIRSHSRRDEAVAFDIGVD